jgi:shikimate kinase
MTSAKRIFLVGYMGCGKTHTGKRLSRKYKVDFIDLDAFIEQRFFSLRMLSYQLEAVQRAFSTIWRR